MDTQWLTLKLNFDPLKYIRPIDIQWTRRYYNCGEFSAQIMAEDYDAAMAYLYTPERPETAIIQKMELTRTAQGNFVQLSGFFFERILNNRIVYPTYYAPASARMGAQCSALAAAYAGDIPLLHINASALGPISAAWQATGGEVGEVLYARLQTAELSYRCVMDYAAQRAEFHIWQGVDRTQNQSANNFVVISSGFRNLSEIHVTRDHSNYKNWALVAGSGEGDSRITVVVDQSNGTDPRRVFVDAKGESYNAEKQTLAEYQATLHQKGVEALQQNYADISNIEVEVQSASYVYLEDFDLGDKVDVEIAELGYSLQARIVCVKEVWNKGKHTVTLELGDQLLTDFQKARI